MKCPKCKGKTEYFKEVFNDGKRRREILVECDMCHGSGEVPMTEQEYLQTCNTEQLAEFLACVEARQNADYNEETKAWVEWLKQPHSFE